jgi:hypothetical protein
MADVILQSTGNPTLFEVIANGRIVGRIIRFSTGRKRSKPWVWSIELPFREGHAPAYGYEATREAAMKAFAKAWNCEQA